MHLFEFSKKLTKNYHSDDFLDVFFELEAGGKPSTWFPPGGLVEHILKNGASLTCMKIMPARNLTQANQINLYLKNEIFKKTKGNIIKTEQKEE